MTKTTFFKVGDRLTISNRFLNLRHGSVTDVIKRLQGEESRTQTSHFIIVEINYTCSASHGGGCPQHGCPGRLVLKRCVDNREFLPGCYGYGDRGFLFKTVDLEAEKRFQKFGIAGLSVNHRNKQR